MAPSFPSAELSRQAWMALALALTAWIAAGCVATHPADTLTPPYIVASPNPAPRGNSVEHAVVELRWDAGVDDRGRVTVSVNRARPVVFSESARGRSTASWIASGSEYEFVLYGEDSRTPLASVHVTRRGDETILAAFGVTVTVLAILLVIGGAHDRARRDRRRLYTWLHSRPPDVWLTLAALTALTAKSLYANLAIDPALHAGTHVQATFGAVLLLAAFVAAVPHRGRVTAAVTVNLLGSLLLVTDLVHMRFFTDPASVAQLRDVWQLGSVGAAVLSRLTITDLMLLADVLLLVALAASRPPTHVPKPQTFRARCRAAAVLGVAGALGCAPAVYLLMAGPKERLEWRTTGDAVGVLGFLPYHIYDIALHAANELWRGRVGEPEVALVTRVLHERREVRARPSPHFGVAAGRNLIVVQAESLQAFPLGRRVGSQSITPYLDAFAAESLSFPNFYDQTGAGSTSDAIFIALQSLHPLPPGEGALATRYAGNHYHGLPALLGEAGYATMAAMGAAGKYWNIDGLHQQLGFQKAFYETAYPDSERFGQGVADGDFFAQTAAQLEQQRRPFFAFLVSMSNHLPYDLPGHHRHLDVGELGDTDVARYLQSVHYFDRVFGLFIRELRRAGLLESSVVVVYGDHQARLEDSAALARIAGTDAESPYDYWQLRKKVPLLIRLPGGHLKGPRPAAGGHLDIAPTLLSLLGISTPEAVMLGADLLTEPESPVAFRDGSVAVGDRYFIDAPALGSEPVCRVISTGTSIDCAPLEPARVQARERLRVSDVIIREDLVVPLTRGGLLTPPLSSAAAPPAP